LADQLLAVDETHPQQEIGMILVQICRAHRNLVASALDKLHIHAGQDHVLHRLAVDEGVTQAGLAEALCVDASTVTKTLARLERDGLIERRSNPGDAREWRVHLTDRGQALVRPVIDIWTEAEGQLTQGLTEAERLLLRRLLVQVLHNLT
jgi:DNA-binding MarR family transcriptional regulator